MRTLFTSIVSWILIFSMVSSPLMVSAASRSVSLERQYQRLYGRKVKTKAGAFTVRQMVDSKGHPYKQIIVGPRFSEIQIDSNRDGRVDIWEIDSGSSTVTMTGPARGQFSRMQVVDRTGGRGTMTVSYLLSPDGKRYNHQKTVIQPVGVARYTDTFVDGDSGPQFEVDAIVTDPPPSSTKPPESFEPFVPDSMMLYQMEQFDSSGQCLNAMTDPLAGAQRAWWSFLRDQGKISRDELGAQIRDSMLFDANCRRPEYEKDYEDLARGIADIMMTSSLGVGQSETAGRGRFLQCLENSNLALTAARLEKKFMSAVAVEGPKQDAAPITCNWDPKGGRVKASYIEKDRNGTYIDQIDMRMCTRHAGTDKYAYGAPINYRNLVFHELMHSAGFRKEGDVDKIVGCCGEPSAERDKACKDLDALVAGNQRAVRIESRLGNNKAAVDEMIYKMEDSFNTATSPDGAEKVYKKYLEQLATDIELNACLGLKGKEQIECRSDQFEKVSSSTEDFFKRQCVDLVERKSVKQCRIYDEKYGMALSRAVTEGLFGSLGCGDRKAALPVSDFFAWLILGSKAIASDCADTTDAPGRDGESPGGAISVDPPTPRIVLPPVTDGVDGPAPRTIVESPATSGPVGDGSKVPGTQPAPIAVPDNRSASPLPITRIDKEPRPERYVEDRYRQATDFAGRATAGLSKLRQAILPEAEASERSRGSTDFVAFRPGKARGYNAAIESPFKNWRGLASVNSGAVAGSSAPINTTAMAASSRGTAAGLEAPDTKGAQRSMNKKSASASLDGDGGRSSVASGVQSGQGSVAPAAAIKTGSNSGSSSTAVREVASTSALDGLFTKPYREIEYRLVRIEVIEQLMKQKIAIKDAKGRSLGSSRPIKKYQFVRQDRPLAEVP
ncbi:MAG: hypothetical protein JNJ49_10095 [Bdellovibrionaceae bacterium]|nr:hypothetical protein [Pseudobdellovibrionaceae bacterium]